MLEHLENSSVERFKVEAFSTFGLDESHHDAIHGQFKLDGVTGLLSPELALSHQATGWHTLFFLGPSTVPIPWYHTAEKWQIP